MLLLHFSSEGELPANPQLQGAVTVSATPLAEAKGTWVACSPETVNDFSGVAYFFARDIHRQLGVPVGLIHSALGSTPAQAWTSLEGLKSEPELQEYVEIVKRRLANYDADFQDPVMRSGGEVHFLHRVFEVAA